jgi:hypothetical protein
VEKAKEKGGGGDVSVYMSKREACTPACREKFTQQYSLNLQYNKFLICFRF